MAEWLTWALDLDVGQRAAYAALLDAFPAVTGGNDRLRYTLWLSLAHTAPFVALNLLYQALGMLFPSAIERYRFQPNKHAPRDLVLHCIKHVLVGHALTPLGVYLFFPLHHARYPGMMATDGVPGLGTFAWQLLVCVVSVDFLFYWSHRALHEVPGLYKRFHKQHHEFKVTVGWAAEYAHPVEHLLGNTVPVIFAPVFFRFHFSVFATWLAIAIVGTVAAHSGIWYPAAEAAWHDFHHSHNVGNYGHTSLWDRIFGTNKAWEAHLKRHPYFTASPTEKGPARQ